MLAKNLKRIIKKTLFPAEQKRADIQEAREIFIEKCAKMDAEKLIFIDESGIHLGMTRHYGRAMNGERVKCYEPFNKGTRFTMIAAIGLDEVKTATLGDWHVDGQIFLEFIRECLVPILEPGHRVFLDNLSTHKVAGIKELINATGAELTYLPAYSPDLTPIELFWSKIKALLRKYAARNFRDLKEAVGKAFKEVTKSDLQGWFEHCGYCIQ